MIILILGLTSLSTMPALVLNLIANLHCNSVTRGGILHKDWHTSWWRGTLVCVYCKLNSFSFAEYCIVPATGRTILITAQFLVYGTKGKNVSLFGWCFYKNICHLKYCTVPFFTLLVLQILMLLNLIHSVLESRGIFYLLNFCIFRGHVVGTFYAL